MIWKFQIIMDLPEELWDEPSAEVSVLKQQCELILSTYEDELQEWFVENKAKDDLTEILCKQRYLYKSERECLDIQKPLPKDDL